MHPIIPLASDEPISPRANIEPLRTPSFSLGTLFLAVAWLCVLLALAKVAIGFALFLAILSVPAYARALWLNEQYARHGRQVSPGLNAALFLSSIGAVVVTIAAGIGTFLAACFGLIMLVATLYNGLPDELLFDVFRGLAMLLTTVGFVAAFFLGIWVGTRTEKLLRPRIRTSKRSASAAHAVDKL